MPIRIDGTDITGATIDGTDVQEITVDGQTVFSAGLNLPVAYSNLAAWYPFDSATYGGSNADDVTAIIGGSGDDTAYNGTVNGATYQSSGGVTDINAGTNSGQFDFDGSDDVIDLQTNNLSNIMEFQPYSISLWINTNNNSQNAVLFGIFKDRQGLQMNTFQSGIYAQVFDGTLYNVGTGILPSGLRHVCMTHGGNVLKLYIDGSLDASQSGVGNINTTPPPGPFIGERGDGAIHYEGGIDDVRVYNTELSATQVQQIYNNTDP